MEALFESGLKSNVARETEVGLAGELLIVAEAADVSAMLRRWHSSAGDNFDFSSEGERLEAKTSTSAERVHWFSSRQLEPIPGVCTSFVSVQLPEVEVGSTVSSMFASMTGLTPEERARVRQVIIAAANEPPEALASIVFDRDAARASLLHVSPSSVPAPDRVVGVGRMRWEATLGPDASPPAGDCGFTPLLGF